MEARFHPEAVADRKFIDSLGIKPYSEYANVEEVRKELWRLAGKMCNPELEFEGNRQEIIVPSPHCADGIPVFVYKPSSAPPDAAILVYFHGGGFVLGSRIHADAACKTISKLSNCIVVNVEYRLAPEHPYPAAVQDAVSTTQWVIQNPDKIGGSSSSKIGVGGDSAGGTLAAIVAHDISGLAFQILVYPRVTKSTLPSRKEFENIPGLNKQLMEWFQKLTYPKPEEVDMPYINVLHRDKFDHLPPALFVVAELDPLRDDSYEYQKKLILAGVEAELYYLKGVLHGYFLKPGCYKETTHSSYQRVAEFITKIAK